MSDELNNSIKTIEQFLKAEKSLKSSSLPLHRFETEVKSLQSLNNDLIKIKSLPKSKLRDDLIIKIEQELYSHSEHIHIEEHEKKIEEIQCIINELNSRINDLEMQLNVCGWQRVAIKEIFAECEKMRSQSANNKALKEIYSQLFGDGSKT